MKIALLSLLLTACASTQPLALCTNVSQPNALTSACTQQPACRRNCYVTLTVANSTGAGDQTVTSNDTATMTETRSRNLGPLP